MEDSLKYIVFITTNLKNNKILIETYKSNNTRKFDGYLGCGVNINNKHSYRYSKNPFAYDVQTYGKKNFIRKTIAEFNNLDEALKLENILVNKEFIEREDTYNTELNKGIVDVNSKEIYQYDLNGNFIKSWESIAEAAISNKCSTKLIGTAIFNGTKALKSLWTDIKSNKLKFTKEHVSTSYLETYLYDKEGNLINSFNNQIDCAKFLNVTNEELNKAIRGAYLFLKEYYCSNKKYDKLNISDKTEFYKNHKLYQYDLYGNFIKEWSNYYELVKHYGKNINVHVAIKTGKPCNGYQWSWNKLDKLKDFTKTINKNQLHKFYRKVLEEIN